MAHQLPPISFQTQHDSSSVNPFPIHQLKAPDAESACRALQKAYRPQARSSRKELQSTALDTAIQAIESTLQFSLPPQVLSQIATFSLSPSTLNAYAPIWSDWASWAQEHKHQILPAQPQDLALYFTLRGQRDVERNLSSANMKLRFAAINFFHKLCNYPAPSQAFPLLKQLLNSFRRQLGARNVSKTALSRRHILHFEQHHGQITLGRFHTPVDMTGPAYLFAFALMFEASLRFDDVIAPLFSDVVWGEDSVRFFLVETKTDRERQGLWASIVADTQVSIAYRYFTKILNIIFGTWLLAPHAFKIAYCQRYKLQISDQFPLDQIHLAAKWEHFEVTTPHRFQAWLPVPHTAIKYNDAILTLKRWGSLVGLNPDDIGTHSLRRGGCSEDAILGLPDTLTMKNGRWKSKISPSIYTETTSHMEARLKALRRHPHLYQL